MERLRNKKHVLIAASVVVLSFFLIAAALLFSYQVKRTQERRNAEFSQVLEGEQPGTYTDLEGNPLSLRQYAGKKVVVLTWASWCPACGEQLKTVSQSLKGQQDEFVFLAINRKEPLATIRAYFDFIGKPENVTFVVDTQDHFFTASKGTTVPELVVYDTKGEERAHIRGTFGEEEFKDALAR